MKNKLKLALDAVMTLLLLVLFKKNSVSLQFHEVVGIFGIAAMIVHFAVNFAWMRGVAPRFLLSGLPARMRIGWAINALMFLDIVLLAVSSVLISKKLFKINAGAFWIRWHFFSAQLLLTLIGLHLGLHFNHIKNTLSSKKGGRGRLFLSRFFPQSRFSLCTRLQRASICRRLPLRSELRLAVEIRNAGQMGQGAEQGMERSMEQGVERGAGDLQEGQSPKRPPHIQPEFSAKVLLKTIWQVFSIMILFAMVSFLIDEAGRKRNKGGA